MNRSTATAILLVMQMILGFSSQAQSATVPDQFEPDDSPGEATTVFVGDSPQYHDFHREGDEDWVRFYAPEGVPVAIKVDEEGEGTDAVLELYDANGNSLLDEPRDWNPSGYGEQISGILAEEPDTYFYVRVSNCSNETCNMGPFVDGTTGYRLSIYYETAPFNGTLVGTVVSAETACPLAGAQVTVTDTVPDLHADVLSNGYYLITAIEAGTHTIEVRADGYRTATASVAISEGNQTTQQFRLVSDGSAIENSLSCHTGLGRLEGVNQDWSAVPTAYSLTSPILIVGPPTDQDNEPAIVRTEWADSTDSEPHAALRMAPWTNSADATHGAESLSYLVLDAGRYQASDGSTWEAGSVTLDGEQGWGQFHFSREFVTPPALFLTVQSTEDGNPVVVRARNVTASGYEAALFGPLNNNPVHGTETIGYLAIYTPSGSGRVQLGGGEYPYLLQQVTVNGGSERVLSSTIHLQGEAGDVSAGEETLNVLAVGRQLFVQTTTTASDITAVPRWTIPDTSGGESGIVRGVGRTTTTVPLLGEFDSPNVRTKGSRRVRNAVTQETTDSFGVRAVGRGNTGDVWYWVKE